MTTITQARQAVKARVLAGNVVDAASVAVAFRFQNQSEDSKGRRELPDTPEPFAYVEMITKRPPRGPEGVGGGRGNNLYRVDFDIHAYVFVPKGQGLDESEVIAEQIAVLFRSYRSDDISCFAATVHPGGDGAQIKPPGLASEVGNYHWALVAAQGYFEQIG